MSAFGYTAATTTIACSIQLDLDTKKHTRNSACTPNHNTPQHDTTTIQLDTKKHTRNSACTPNHNTPQHDTTRHNTATAITPPQSNAQHRATHTTTENFEELDNGSQTLPLALDGCFHMSALASGPSS
jgi:hypothetical protein